MQIITNSFNVWWIWRIFSCISILSIAPCRISSLQINEYPLKFDFLKSNKTIIALMAISFLYFNKDYSCPRDVLFFYRTKGPWRVKYGINFNLLRQVKSFIRKMLVTDRRTTTYQYKGPVFPLRLYIIKRSFEG